MAILYENPLGGQGVCREVEFPVRIWGMDASGRPFIQTAHTVSVSPNRVRIAGLKHEVLAGEILGLGYENRKARFVVVLAEKTGTPDGGKIEMRPLEMPANFWRLNYNQVTVKRHTEERRNVPRFPCKGSISFRQEGESGSVAAAVADISLSGCYVELLTSLPVGSTVSALIRVDKFTVRCEAIVRTSHPGVGMGIEFQHMLDEDRTALQNMIDTLREGSR